MSYDTSDSVQDEGDILSTVQFSTIILFVSNVYSVVDDGSPPSTTTEVSAVTSQAYTVVVPTSLMISATKRTFVTIG